MLREGYYGRDRKRFFDYMPMSKKDPMVYITPITDYFANQDVMIKNTDVYYSKEYTFDMIDGRVIKNSIIIEDFELDPSNTKYRLYMDGLLLDYDYDYVASVNMADRDELYYMGDPFTIFVRKEFNWDMQHSLIFEYLPYRYQLIYRSAETDGVIVLADEFIRPYDPRNFDIYMDGKLLREDEIEIVTERRIIIKPIVDNLDTLTRAPIVSVYEKMHDADVFTTVWRNTKTGFDYVDHDTPVIEVDDKTWFNKVKTVIVKGENDDPDDTSGTSHPFDGIYVYANEDNNMVLDLTTHDNNDAMIDPNVDPDNKFVEVDYYHIPNTDPQEYDVTKLIVPYDRTATTPRKVGKTNVKRYPNDPTKTINVKMGEPIKHSLDEQIIRTDEDYRRSRTPTYISSTHVI
jgi:hypothetical protein